MSEAKSLDPEVEYALLSGIDKAAILVSSLGPTSAKKIFKYMRDNDVKRLISQMATVNKSPIWVVKKVLEEFYASINEDDEFLFAGNKGRDFILDALGEDRAKQLLGQTVEVGMAQKLDSLELVDTRTLSNFLIHEHPQTIALIVAHLETEKKVNVIRKLPETLQAEVVLRVANIDFVSPDLIGQLDEVLKTELSTLGSIDTQQLGGVEPIAEMLNHMDKNSEKNVMARVEEKDPELAEEIRKLMFVFEDLVYVDDNGMRELLKGVDNQKLTIALKTAPEEVKSKIFGNMSNRAANLLKEDLEALGPMKLSDVESAQQEIVMLVKDLEAKGSAVISRGGETDTMV